jgi:hypothetical protein
VTTNIHDNGAKLPVPTLISATVTKRTTLDRSPNGNHSTRVTREVNTFIKMAAFRGPSQRSASQGGTLLPMMAPLQGRRSVNVPEHGCDYLRVVRHHQEELISETSIDGVCWDRTPLDKKHKLEHCYSLHRSEPIDMVGWDRLEDVSHQIRCSRAAKISGM